MTAGIRISKKALARALRQAGGIKADAARILGVDRVSVWRCMKRWPELQEIVTEAADSLFDEAFVGLRQLVAERHPAAIIFVVKCLGKKHGFTERHEVTGADGAPLVDVHKLSTEELQRIAGRPAAASVGGIGAATPGTAVDKPN